MKKRLFSTVLALALCLGLLAVPALAAEADPVPYVAYTWNEGTSTLSSTTTSVTEYTVVTSDPTTWSDGWYVVNGPVTIDGGVSVSGDVHLILTDGSSLTVTGDVSFGEGVSLTVYGQTQGTGTLTVGGSLASGSNGNNSKGGSGGSVTVNGGTVTVSGSMACGGNGGNNAQNGAGYDGGNGGSVTVNCGTVVVTGSIACGGSGGNGDYQTSTPTGGNGGSGGSVTVNGGTVEVTGSMACGGSGGYGNVRFSPNSKTGGQGGQGGSGGSVIVNGGSVTVTNSIACGGNGGNGGYGDSYSSSNSGAGGSGGNGSTVTIGGGTVTIGGSMACGGSGGSGGYGYYTTTGSGGNGGNGSTVIISGGTVEVTGSMACGGSGGNGGDAKPTSGTKGGNGGNGGDGGTVTVSGSATTVKGSLADRGNRGNRGSGGFGGYSRGSYGSYGDYGTVTGIIYQNNVGTVYGDVTLENDIVILEGATLTVPEGASLTVNGDIINNGTLILQTKDSLTCTGSITDTGTNTILSITVEQISVPTDLVYNGTDQTAAVRDRIYLKDMETIFGANFTYDIDSWDLDAISPAAVKDAGDYTVSYKNGENTVSTTFSVGKRLITNENTSVGGFASMTYNGQAQTPASDLVVDLGDGRTETITGVTWSNVTNVTDTTTATVAESTNFTGITLTKPTGMNALDLSTVTIEKETALTYTGGELTQQTTVTEPGGNIVTGYTVSGNTATTVKIDGNYVLTISAGENMNYTGSKTFEWNIEPKPVTATAHVAELYWGDAPVIDSVTIPDVYEYDTVIVTGLTVSVADATAVGNSVTFNVDSTGAAISGSGHENYDVTIAPTATGKVKVIPLTISGVSMGAESYTYGGDAVGYDNTALTISQPGGTEATAEDLVYTYTGTANDGSTWNSTDAPTKAGSYTLTVSHSDTLHYSGSQSVSFTIERKPVEEPAQAEAVTYNGTAQTYAVTETAYYSVTGGVQTAANEAGHVVTISLKDSNNTCWGDESLNDLIHNFVINKATITITAENKSAYRGSNVPELTYKVEGLMDGEELTSVPTLTTDADMTTTGTYAITVSGADAGDNYTITYTAGTLTVRNRPSSSTTSKTEKNEDGSITTTTTNKTTGTVTETTKYPDGSTTTVETKKDGSTTETSKTSEGTTGTVVTDKDGNVTEVSAQVPAAAAKDAEESGKAVQLPVEVEVADDADEAVEIEVDVPTGGAKVELPVEDVTSGTVVVIVNKDGTEEIVKTSTITENGVVVTLDKDAIIKVIDNSKHFVDVHPVNHWAEEAVDFVVARGIYSGTSATTFHPDNPMTRGMLAVVLHNLEDNPNHAFDDVFHDVAEGSWYEDAIHWAADSGIVSGYGNGLYGPNDNITREQLAVMLWRYAGGPENDHNLSHFVDADQISGYAREALAWANENGIINGKGGGILDPKGNATRAQVAQMLKNFLEKAAK